MKEQNNIWFEDANNLFNKNNFFDIIPLVDMTFEEKINSITRFSIYLSIILIIFTGNLNNLYIPISAILLFYLVYIFKPKYKESFNTNTNANNADNNNNENSINIDSTEPINKTNAVIEPVIEDLSNCRKPTKDNPLMNLQIKDFSKSAHQRACNINNDEIKETIDNSFDDKLYLNTEVVYNTKFNQRNFYTMPNTRSYADQGSFANWLYNTPVSCAEGKENELKQVRACSFSNKRLDEVELM
jgi:hypothetical protein